MLLPSLCSGAAMNDLSRELGTRIAVISPMKDLLSCCSFLQFHPSFLSPSGRGSTFVRTRRNADRWWSSRESKSSDASSVLTDAVRYESWQSEALRLKGNLYVDTAPTKNRMRHESWQSETLRSKEKLDGDTAKTSRTRHESSDPKALHSKEN